MQVLLEEFWTVAMSVLRFVFTLRAVAVVLGGWETRCAECEYEEAVRFAVGVRVADAGVYGL